ncbi:MAG: benzoyl-CoA reductase subunit A [Deltaproteobacteria bacterium]|nr:benzoyl-CoA reductase subunit A [Deltaproteobacteria bacterium]
MKCVVGIDLGSTTTKAVLLDLDGAVIGRGITNSRSNYGVACAVALEEAHTTARMHMLRVAFEKHGALGADELHTLLDALQTAFRLELFLAELGHLKSVITALMKSPLRVASHPERDAAVEQVLTTVAREAPRFFARGNTRRSDFFRDLAGEAFMSAAEAISGKSGVPFEQIVGLYDRAIIRVETELERRDFATLLAAATERVAAADEGLTVSMRADWKSIARQVAAEPLEDIAFTGTGYGRQTLPFPKDSVRSEILCHGRGAHHMFPGTRTVLDIGGQDTKAIQIDARGLVSTFQMNDRCAAGCGRYLGYIADELNLGLHELGPLALQAKRVVKVNSTCTVFAGAELRERLALGERREDILAGLHRSIMLRAMSLLARSGGISSEFTFTGGVCKNPMATKMLAELVRENYGDLVHINIHHDSIYMGALGAALYALDDVRAGKPGLLPAFATATFIALPSAGDAACHA